MKIITNYDADKIPKNITTITVEDFIKNATNENGFDIGEDTLIFEINSITDNNTKDELLLSIETYRNSCVPDIHYYDYHKMTDYNIPKKELISVFDKTIDNLYVYFSEDSLKYIELQKAEQKVRKIKDTLKSAPNVTDNEQPLSNEEIAEKNDFVIGESLTPEEITKLVSNTYKIFTVKVIRDDIPAKYYDCIAYHPDKVKLLFKDYIDKGYKVKIIDENPIYSMILNP